MYDLEIIMAQRKLNNRAERIELPKAFTDKFPDMSIEKAQKRFDRYLTVVGDLLLSRLPWINNSTTHVSLNDLMNGCGEFNYKKQRYYVWNEFKDIYPLFRVIDLGNNLKQSDTPFEKNTKVELVNQRFITMLLHEKSPKRIMEELFPDIDTIWNEVEKVAIDAENLQNFIHNTEYELSKLKTAQLNGADATMKKRQRLEKNLWQAIIIQKVGEYTEANYGEAMLPMIQKPSPFGRIYYKGLSIQNVTKQVRGAILGPHFQYDMNAAVYGVKLALFNRIIGGENKLTGTPIASYTREYLSDKNVIRKRLAETVFAGVDLSFEYKLRNIKNALTAIGFGAKTTSGFWIDENDVKGPALTEIIKSKDARDKFLNDPWVAAFIKEQEYIEDAILNSIKADEGMYADICNVVKTANGKNGKATRPLILAYIYQQTETSIMDMAFEIMEAHGIRPLARIHDAFITDKELPIKVLDEIYMEWSKESSHIRLELDRVQGWIDIDFKKALDLQKQQEADHYKFIEAEEYKAFKKSRVA